MLDSERCEREGIPPRGTEHPHDSPKKTPVSEAGGAQSGAPAAQSTVQDPDLQQLIDAWPTLPPVVRAGIVAMVKAAKGTSL